MPAFTKRLPSVVISNLKPRIENGRYPVKRIEGELLDISADVFKDGHDVISVMLLGKQVGDAVWQAQKMKELDNDRWGATVSFKETGTYLYKVRAFADLFETWLHDFERRLTGDQEDFSTEIEEGRIILAAAAERAKSEKKQQDAEAIETLVKTLTKAKPTHVPKIFEEEQLHALLGRYPDMSLAAESEEFVEVRVEHERAQFSAWYEFFPRSAKGSGTEHSTFRDCLPRMEDAKKMGFNVIYFPPIHPIGVSHRKGKNNSVTCEPDDVGSPWAIGSLEGGHRSVEPALGTVDDFVWLLKETKKMGMDIALDFAINCSPDHPYVRNHPEWFYQRPDGTIKYAENPPKKYQDIYPLNFHCDDWQNLWNEMLSVVQFWVDKGVKIFRVDNPHTKPVAFWEWLIAGIHKDNPEIIFLAEAFTRPKMMQTLGKAGFTQSYTYFTWRETKWEIMEYVYELTKGEMRNYYTANFWPNTPDILPFHLQNARPPAFKIRAALAATLSTSWGIYSGYELCENKPLEGREEYLDSEKYQLKERDWNKIGHIKAFIFRLNKIRNENAAMREYANIEFIATDNDEIIAYYKWTDDLSNIIICVVNLDPTNTQSGNLHLEIGQMGIQPGRPFEVVDLMYDETYQWRDSTNFVSLDPNTKPVHVLKLVRS
ncbi:MAG: alpha-1,4-glucan--maltose-1-phosphate maltosyltransferase [Verrucomicrobiales bacterium]|nr:alpha-1,4-glucan--maltose-1-phosphate maltosyltransferase [Verrucomicrobiales bacterium]